MLIRKVPAVSAVVTPTVLNTKICEVKNKIPDFSGLVTTTVLNTKLEKLRTIYLMLVVWLRKQIIMLKCHTLKKKFTTSDYCKFTVEILDTKLKQVNLATNTDANTVSQRTNKKQEKIEKRQMFGLSYFLGKIHLVIIVFKICCLSTNI